MPSEQRWMCFRIYMLCPLIGKMAAGRAALLVALYLRAIDFAPY